MTLIQRILIFGEDIAADRSANHYFYQHKGQKTYGLIDNSDDFF